MQIYISLMFQLQDVFLFIPPAAVRRFFVGSVTVLPSFQQKVVVWNWFNCENLVRSHLFFYGLQRHHRVTSGCRVDSALKRTRKNPPVGFCLFCGT